MLLANPTPLPSRRRGPPRFPKSRAARWNGAVMARRRRTLHGGSCCPEVAPLPGIKELPLRQEVDEASQEDALSARGKPDTGAGGP